MANNQNQATLNELVNAAVAKKDIFGAVFCVTSRDDDETYISAAGNIGENSRYYIASINKLFVSAITLRLCAERKLDLHDPIAKHLPPPTVSGLHRFKGKDYSSRLTILHLLSLTSGLPCYALNRQANGRKAMAELEAGMDQAWPLDKVVREVKLMTPHFAPGTPGRAKYGDTNHQILSLIIECVTGEPIPSVLKNLLRELHLADTFVCESGLKQEFVPLYYRSDILHLPQFLNSTGNDLISTARDQMTFLRAFFDGYFFPKERLHELEKWNPIFFPFHYGIGIQKFRVPRLLAPIHPVPEMIGHCGSTGSVAFYVPEARLFITGTVNQQAKPNVAFQTMIRLLRKWK